MSFGVVHPPIVFVQLSSASKFACSVLDAPCLHVATQASSGQSRAQFRIVWQVLVPPVASVASLPASSGGGPLPLLEQASAVASANRAQERIPI